MISRAIARFFQALITKQPLLQNNQINSQVVARLIRKRASACCRFSSG